MFYFNLAQRSSKAKQVINVRPTMSAAFTNTLAFKQISGIKNLSTQSLSKIIKNTLLLYPLCVIIHHATSPRIILNGLYLNSIMNSQDSSVLATHTKYKSSPSKSDQNPTVYIRLCIACCIYKAQSFQGMYN